MAEQTELWRMLRIEAANRPEDQDQDELEEVESYG